jgi:hypothetical protein
MQSSKQVLERTPQIPYSVGAQPPPSDHLEIDMHDRRGSSPPNTETMTREILSRSRRIETRLTSLLVAMGFDTEAQRPDFFEETSVLQIPSQHSSLKECLAAIPDGWSKPVTIKIGSDKLLVLELNT